MAETLATASNWAPFFGPVLAEENAMKKSGLPGMQNGNSKGAKVEYFGKRKLTGSLATNRHGLDLDASGLFRALSDRPYSALTQIWAMTGPGWGPL